MARPYSRAKHQVAALVVSAKGHIVITVTGRGLRCFVGQNLPKRPKYRSRGWLRQQDTAR